MRYVNEYDKLHATCYDYLSSIGGIALQYGSATDALKYYCNTFDLIYIWIQKFDTSYVYSCNDFHEK